MKHIMSNFYIKMASFCIVGLILMGVGTGIFFMECMGLKTVKADDMSVAERTYYFPESGEVYLTHDAVTEADDKIQQGTFVLEVKYSCNDIKFGEITKAYKRSHVDPNMNISAYLLGMPQERYDAGGDYEKFRDIMLHLKNNELYISDYTASEYKIRVNPIDQDRIKFSYDSADVYFTSENETFSEPVIDELPDKNAVDVDENTIPVEGNTVTVQENTITEGSTALIQSTAVG